MKKTVILACPTLKGELQTILSEEASEAVVYFLPRGLHSDPKKLHSYVQNMIDSFWNVDRIVLCVTGCGGGTVGLRATTAELVVPRTRDCLDILLSDESLSSLERDISGVYFTESWMEYSRESEIDLDRLVGKMGKEPAEDFLRNLYKTCNKFYIIDTGCYDVKKVDDYVAPLVKVLSGTVTMLKGKCGILRKIAGARFDEDFVVVPKGNEIPAGVFLKNF